MRCNNINNFEGHNNNTTNFRYFVKEMFFPFFLKALRCSRGVDNNYFCLEKSKIKVSFKNYLRVLIFRINFSPAEVRLNITTYFC